MLQLHISVFLFGIVGVFGKFLLLPATTIVFGRTVLAAAVLLLILLLQHGTGTCQLLRNGWRLIPSGILLALHWFTFFYSIQLSSVATGLLAIATVPVFVALLDPLFSRRPPQRIDIVYAFIVCAGLSLVVPEYDFGNLFFQGLLWGLVSSLTFALLTLFNRRFVHRTDAMVVGFFQNLWAGACLIPWYAPLLALDSRGWVLMLFLGIVCTALSHTLFISALRTVRAQLASVAAGLEPVYGILMAILLLGEYPGVRELVGGTIIVATVIFASMHERR